MLNNCFNRGLEQFTDFTLHLDHFYYPILRNNFTLFQTNKSQHKNRDNNLKQDYNLFSNLFISCQTRQVDLDNFFKFENQGNPASLNSDGEIYKTQKAELMQCLESIAATQ